MKRFATTMVTVAAALLAGAAPAAAQSWPAKPVRVVNTFAAGGTADVLARLVADLLSAAFKQQFFVETRAGATGRSGCDRCSTPSPTTTISCSRRSRCW